MYFILFSLFNDAVTDWNEWLREKIRLRVENFFFVCVNFVIWLNNFKKLWSRPVLMHSREAGRRGLLRELDREISVRALITKVLQSRGLSSVLADGTALAVSVLSDFFLIHFHTSVAHYPT